MKKTICFLLMLVFASTVNAQSVQPNFNEVSLKDLISSFAKSTNQKFVIDPRVKGKAQLLGLSKDSISIADLTTVLHTHNFAVIKSGQTHVVVPANIIKNESVPMVVEGKDYEMNEYVTDLIHLERVCARDTVALMRPLLSPLSHFAPVMESNSVLMVTTYANTLKIREILSAIESKVTSKRRCTVSN